MNFSYVIAISAFFIFKKGECRDSFNHIICLAQNANDEFLMLSSDYVEEDGVTIKSKDYFAIYKENPEEINADVVREAFRKAVGVDVSTVKRVHRRGYNMHSYGAITDVVIHVFVGKIQNFLGTDPPPHRGIGAGNQPIMVEQRWVWYNRADAMRMFFKNKKYHSWKILEALPEDWRILNAIGETSHGPEIIDFNEVMLIYY